MSSRSKGKWTYIGNVFVGVVADCDCPPVEASNKTDGPVVYPSQPHESHAIVPVIGEEDLSDWMTMEQRRANCRLIAAAPELLDACMSALHYIRSNPHRRGRDPQVAKTLEVAIEKAIEPKETP